MFYIERIDGSVDGLGDKVAFETEAEAWEAAERAFGSDPASVDGVRTWLRVVEALDPDAYCREHGTPRWQCDESH